MMARSRSPFVVVMSGAFRSAWACFSDSQFPVRTPIDLALFTRAMPAASSGASSPLSAASTASFRTAVIRTLMETDAQPAGLQGNAPGAHGRLGEAGPRLLADTRRRTRPARDCKRAW